MPLYNFTSDVQVNEGSYTGDGTADRAIPHGLPREPLLVVIGYNGPRALIQSNRGYLSNVYAGKQFSTSATTSTNFYVGDGLDDDSMNKAATAYQWVAIST